MDAGTPDGRQVSSGNGACRSRCVTRLACWRRSCAASSGCAGSSVLSRRCFMGRCQNGLGGACSPPCPSGCSIAGFPVIGGPDREGGTADRRGLYSKGPRPFNPLCFLEKQRQYIGRTRQRPALSSTCGAVPHGESLSSPFDAMWRPCWSTASPLLKGETVMSDVQNPAPVPSRHKVYSRPSLLDRVTLSDGRLAWPVAKAAGLHEATFRARLASGVSPDDAIAPVSCPSVPGGLTAAARASGLSVQTVRKRLARGLPADRAIEPLSRPRLSDGRLASQVAKAAGVSSSTFWHRVRRGGWSVEQACGLARPPVRRGAGSKDA